MKRWLDGDLDGVDPRAEQDLLRDALAAAVAEGRDPAPMLTALADLDAVACAELVVGSRAVAHPAVVRASLHAAEALETVVPPAGLYRRLAVLAPDLLDVLVQHAIQRHGGPAWVWRLAEAASPPGGAVLRALAGPVPPPTPAPPADESWIRTQEACDAALDHDCVAAVVARARAGDAPAFRALYDRAPRPALLAAVAGLFDDGVSVPAIAWLAAWHGPDVDPLLAAVVPRLQTARGRDALRNAVGTAPGLDGVRRALDA